MPLRSFVTEHGYRVALYAVPLEAVPADFFADPDGHWTFEALAKAAGDRDEEVRTAACWALANIGDPAGIDTCLAAAEKATGYERIQAGKARLLFAERLRDAGHKDEAKKVLGHLRKSSDNESENYLREIADRELAGLS